MAEREPDFEDEKIRSWQTEPGVGDAEGSEEDPTVISLDVEREEIYESRVYHFRAGPKALSYFVNLLLSPVAEGVTGLAWEEVIPKATEMMEQIVIKMLAKRRKEDGRILSLLIAVAPDSRRLLARQGWVEESQYRQAVQTLERDFLPEGVLAPPQIVTLEEWRRYFKEGSLSGGQS